MGLPMPIDSFSSMLDDNPRLEGRLTHSEVSICYYDGSVLIRFEAARFETADHLCF